MELNRIKLLLRELALSHGLTDGDLRKYDQKNDDFEWHIDWKLNLSDELESNMRLLEAAIDLYDSAIGKEDRLTAKAALVDAGITLQGMAAFFDGLTHDIKKAYRDPRFGWPDFPDENWTIPSEYGFREK
ncbi:hypothetical protein ABH945_005958 [Paraburkholderia sp. GAS333]|uniref:hypothetical protein n=1 Tax=Paraburkholderia sp. GAS333 TaxID=3156279 RepID=UPI003D1D8A39